MSKPTSYSSPRNPSSSPNTRANSNGNRNPGHRKSRRRKRSGPGGPTTEGSTEEVRRDGNDGKGGWSLNDNVDDMGPGAVVSSDYFADASSEFSSFRAPISRDRAEYSGWGGEKKHVHLS